MGIVRMGPPEDVVKFLKEKYCVSTFVETGTFLGNTAKWAASLFEKVLTIEFEEKFYKESHEKYSYIDNIRFINGDSRNALKDIVRNERGSILFWLDAHWCGMGSYGENDQCPLMEEISIINESIVPHFILIDDARLFLAPPPLPNKIGFYPGISELINILINKHNRYLAIIEDVIIAVPFNCKPEMQALLQEKTTRSWVDTGNQNKGNINSIITKILHKWFRL